jgi:hypothetical protein
MANLPEAVGYRGHILQLCVSVFYLSLFLFIYLFALQALTGVFFGVGWAGTPAPSPSPSPSQDRPGGRDSSEAALGHGPSGDGGGLAGRAVLQPHTQLGQHGDGRSTTPDHYLPCSSPLLKHL